MELSIYSIKNRGINISQTKNKQNLNTIFVECGYQKNQRQAGGKCSGEKSNCSGSCSGGSSRWSIPKVFWKEKCSNVTKEKY